MSEGDDRAANDDARARDAIVGSALIKAKHDLNNLFHVARGWSRLLQDPRSGLEQTREGIAAVLAAAEQTSELVNGVLALGAAAPARENGCSLGQELGVLARGLRYLCPKPARFELELASRARVRCDYAELKRELIEAVLAARDTLGEDALRLRLTEASNDGGDAELALLRASATNGAVTLRSWRFALEQAGAALRHTTDAQGGVTASPRSILLVDDHRDVRRLATTLLERSGYLVLTAADAEEAQLTSESYDGAIDLLCCAAVLPGRSALELIADLKRARPALKILISADEPPRDALGELPQLAKPFSYQQLLEAVQACFA